MKTKFLVVAVSLCAAAVAHAQSSGGTIERSSSSVNLDNSSISTISGQVGVSMLLRGLSAEAGGGGVIIGGLAACRGASIRNVTTDVKLKDTRIVATGPVHIGHVSAGCE